MLSALKRFAFFFLNLPEDTSLVLSNVSVAGLFLE